MKIGRYSRQAIGMLYLVLILFNHAQAAAIEDQSRLLPKTPGDLTYFSADTAIDGDYAGVVSWGFGAVPSAFHLYDQRSGAALSSVALPETTNTDRFSAIDISGNRLLVGSQRNPIGDNEIAGAALLYDISNPNQPQELLQLRAPNLLGASNFGAQIEFRGDKALIGAYGDSFPNNVPGAAYLYDLSDLDHIQIKSLQPSGGSSPNDFFGATLSMNDEMAIVGNLRGSAYLFDLDSGEQLAVLQSPGAAYSHFGQSVDISGERAIVWSRWNVGSGQAYGAAHLFDISNPTSPTYLATLTGSTPLEETGFQGRVAIEGNWAILSARSSNPDRIPPLDQIPTPGAAYAFNIRDLSDVSEFRLLPSEFWIRSEFGISIDIDQTNVVIGAWGDRVSGIRSGAAYVFSLPEPSVVLLFLQISAVVSVAVRRRRKSVTNTGC